MVKVIIFGNTLVNTMGLIRSVGKMGRKVDLLMEPCLKSRCLVHRSKYVEKVHWLNRMEEALDVLRNEYWNEPEKSVILCGGDSVMCLLDAHYDVLKDHFCIFNARGEQGRINFFMDKSNQFPVAAKCGLNLIKTWHIKGGGDIPEDVIYPCIIKGNNSTSSTKGDMYVCKCCNELSAKLKKGVDYLIQEYVEKDFELDVVGFSWNHGENVYTPAAVNKIRETLTRQSDYIRLDNIDQYKSLRVDAIKRFVREIGYEGIFSIEVLKKEETYYFLEMNLRNDGVGYLYTAAGINYPKCWINYAEGNLINDDAIAKKKRTPYYLMSENDLYNIVEGKVSLWQWLKDFHRTDAFFILDFSDPMPFIYSTWIHFKQMLKKIVRKCCCWIGCHGSERN